MNSNEIDRPIIIGGGIAGLMAALHLAERGLAPLLLEADPDRVGGRLKGGPAVKFEHQGQTWTFPGEHGVHGIWAPYLNFKDTLARHDLLPSLIPAREETWIFGRGKKIRKADMGSAIRGSDVPAPFHYLQLFLRPRFLNMITLRDLASMFRVMGSLFAAMAIDPIQEQKALSTMSLADFMQGWSPNLQSFFAGLARNALAGHPADVPAAGFIAFLRFYTLLRRDAWVYHYLPGSGGDCVSEPLATRVKALGGEIRLGTRVERLERVLFDQAGPEPIWEIYVSRDASSETQHTTQLILAVDAPAAKWLLQNSLTTTQIASKLWFPTGVPTAIFRLWFEEKPRRVAEAGIFTGDFIMDNFFWLDRLQPAYQTWTETTGGSAVEMHVYGPPEILDQPDALLLAQVITQTHRAFPELRGTLLQSKILRNPAAHTLFSVGPPGQHLEVETPWPNLYACGDWIYHPTPALYLERAATTGILAANAVLEARHLDPFLPLPHPQPEWLAGKIEAAWRKVRFTFLKR